MTEQRITTTERHAQLRDTAAKIIEDGWHSSWSDRRIADAVIELVQAEERVRVVEGLVATIKALPVYWVHPALAGFAGAYQERPLEDFKADVLAVVEAAREATDE